MDIISPKKEPELEPSDKLDKSEMPTEISTVLTKS